MKKYALVAAMFAVLLGVPVAAGADNDQRGSHVQGWLMAGSDPADYEFARTGATVDGAAVVRLRSVTDTASGFGTMMQTISAVNYAGGRVRLSGSLKGDGITGWAGLWLRVDGEQRRMLAFDNMADRPITGTTDWTRCDVVLDVGQGAHAIAFGVLLNGPGAVDIAGLRLERVGPEVPVTGAPQVAEAPRPTEPVNLDFSQG